MFSIIPINGKSKGVLSGKFNFDLVKIAVLVNTTWNAVNFRLGLMKHFQTQGWEVMVIAPEDEHVDRIKQDGIHYHPIEMDRGGMNPIKDYRYLRELKKKLKHHRPDVVLSFTIKPNIYGALACRKFKIPIICNVSGLGTTFLWKGWMRWAIVGLYRFAFKNADFIFFQNPEDQSLFKDLVDLSDEQSGLLPGSGVDTQRFHAGPPTFQSTTTFLMISRLIIDKGVEEFIEAAETLSKDIENVRFQLLGAFDPDHKRTISEETMERLRDSGAIDYLGEITDVTTAITSADVIVLPSYREGTPRTLLEGAAMSRPLIATDVPGCREVVEDGVNGYLCAVRDSADLRAKMIQFVELPDDKKEKMAAESRRLVEHRFDEKLVFKFYEDKIKQLNL